MKILNTDDMKILNTVVFYENREEVENYISEVAVIADDMVDIALVVNSDKQSQAGKMETDLRSKGINCFKVIDYEDNVGYLNAMLKTVKQIDIRSYDYIILSNTDIQYDTKEFFHQLAAKKYPADVGCIAPSVFAAQSNSYSNPHYLERIPNPRLGEWYLKLSGLKAGKTRKEKKHSCFVYSPHGCYMIFTGEFIKRIYGYEYGVKMYSE